MPGLIPPGPATNPNVRTPYTQPLPPTSAVLSGSEIQKLWIQYGGNPSAAPMASAIALAESGGNENATGNNSNGTIDRGLFQINSVHGAQSTYNLADNVKAAIAISKNGADWSPWTTYKNGAYKDYLGQKGQAIYGDQPGSIGSSINDAANTVSDIPSAIAGAVSGAFNTAVKDAKYAAVLVAALVIAVVLMTHGLRGSGDGGGRKVVPIPV